MEPDEENSDVYFFLLDLLFPFLNCKMFANSDDRAKKLWKKPLLTPCDWSWLHFLTWGKIS